MRRLLILLLLLMISACSSKLKPKEILLKCEEGSGAHCTLYGATLVDKSNKHNKLSRKYIKQGCDLSNAQGCYLYGEILYKDKQYKKALKTLNQSCTLDSFQGCQLYSKVLMESTRQSTNDVFLEGCKNFRKKMCYKYAQKLYKNDSLKEAKRYYKIACQLNHKKACIKYSKFK
jgi:TPR repeat protein